MQKQQSQIQSQFNESQSSQNDCYSTNQQYFLDLCRFGEFQEIKEFISGTIKAQSNKNTKEEQIKSFQWQWVSNSGDNFIRNYQSFIIKQPKYIDMLSGNNLPQIFDYLVTIMKQQHLPKQKILQILNKQNSSGNTPLHYAVITGSKQMLIKLIQNQCDPNIENQFKRTALAQAQMIQKFDLAQILAPITKQDIQQLKKQFGGLEVCNQNDNDDEDSDQEQQQENKQKSQNQ